jgi:hypothetical protein
MPGWEDKAEELRVEIKEQMRSSSVEQGISREQQGAILLQQVQWKDKEKKDFKQAMLYHQQKADYNTREYQKKRLEIRNLYTELEDIGWNQVVSDEDLEDGESVNSDEAPDYMAAIANAERRADRARENPEDRRIRHNRNRARPVDVVNLLSDEDMAVDGGAAQPGAGAAQAAQAERTLAREA